MPQTPEHPPAERASPADRSPAGYGRSAAAALFVIIPILIIGGWFVSFSEPAEVGAPAGRDTSFYIWRARIVAAEGLGALPGTAPEPYREQAHRAGHPLLAGFTRSIAGVTPFDLAFALPAVMGIAIGLGAGAFALQGLAEPRWAFPVYAVAVGTSVNVTLTGVGRADTLMVMGLAMAVATTALMAADGRATVAVSVLLFVGAAVIHWPFALITGGILLALAVVLLPESVGAWRAGTSPLATPSARLGGLLAASAVAGVGVLALGFSTPDAPSGWRRRVFTKLARHGPKFAALGPAAAVGAVALFFPKDRRRRRGLLLAAGWLATAGLAAGISVVYPVPAHRILPFALGIPLLAAAGVTGIAALLSRARPVALGWGAAAIVVVVALGAGGFLARDRWEGAPKGQGEMIAEAKSAGRYMRLIGGDRPVIFTVNRPGRQGPLNIVRAALPADQIERAYVHVGRPEDLLAGRPTEGGSKKLARNSVRHWEGIEPILDRDPIVLELSAFNPRRELLGTPILPGINLVAGPRPPIGALQSAPPLPTPSPLELAGTVAVIVLLLAAVGVGWAASLVPAGWLTRAALTPALGIAVLVVGGLLAARLGADGPGHRLWLLILLVLFGWAPLAYRALRHQRAAQSR